MSWAPWAAELGEKVARWEAATLNEQIEQRHAERRARRLLAPINPDESDGQLRELAGWRAELMAEQVAELREPVTLDWLNAQVTALEARPLDPLKFSACPPTWAELNEQLQTRIKRATCRYWWSRNVRRAATQKREAREQAKGRVSVRAAPYVGDETAVRYDRQQARNLAMLERTEIESAQIGHDGKPEVITLAAAVKATTANPAIRCGELMTRIRGAEEWATANGMVGVFTTNTAPSRFHAMTIKAGKHCRKNPAYRGATPRDAQGWLCKAWAKTRAAWQRMGVDVFGYRVAEPHHDGCPHWHMLLWCKPEQLDQMRETMRSVWLGRPRWFCAKTHKGAPVFADLIADDAAGRWSCASRWSGTALNLRGGYACKRGAPTLAGELGAHRFERGATEHRFKAEIIDPAKGGAISYVAKYIAKNIDDRGLGAHIDDAEGQQIELDTASGNKARRVLAWASAWGIRQFQAIGQPPVTVWRELRRVDASAAQGASPSLRAAHQSVNREGERRACWRAYMDAQGGAMRGRDSRLKLATELERREGLYGVTEQPRILGVLDVRRPGEVALSSRKAWKPRGTWTADDREAATIGPAGWMRDTYGLAPYGYSARPQAAQPWTRVNNCTQAGGIAALWSAGIVGAVMKTEGPGGLNIKEIQRWTTTRTPRTARRTRPTRPPTAPAPSSRPRSMTWPSWHAWPTKPQPTRRPRRRCAS